MLSGGLLKHDWHLTQLRHFQFISDDSDDNEMDEALDTTTGVAMMTVKIAV